MPSTFSPDLRIELIGAGEQAGTWNTTTNRNLGTVLEDAISGYSTVSVTSANQAFTANDGVADQARNAMIALTTTTAANFAVYAPPASKIYIINNTTAYVATIYNSTVLGNTTAAGTGVAIPAGKKLVVFTNGTNFSTVEASNLTGVLAVANGGTGVTTSTGTGSTVLSNSPTLVTPALGTPTSGTLTNTTGLPIDGGTTGTLPVARGGTGATTATGTGIVVLSDSPTLTGTPAAPTAAVNTNNTQVATTAYVVAQIADDAPTKTGTGASGTWGIDVTGSATKLSTASGSAPSYAARAWVNFNGFPLAGTYGRSGTLVTVTMTAHGMTSGQIANLTFAAGTGGTATSGSYAVTVIDANNFTITDSVSGTITGSPVATRNVFIRASGNVSSITDTGVGLFTMNFATAMPDTNYAVVGVQKWADVQSRIAALNIDNLFTTGVQLLTQRCTVDTSTVQSGYDPTQVWVAVFR